MVNHDKYLLKDPSADGIKTGYTVPAGHCFVGSCTRNGFRVITVVMKSEHWQLDHQALLHWAFGNFSVKDRVTAGQLVAQVAVSGGVKDKVTGVLGADASVVLQKGASVDTVRTFEPVSQLVAPVEKGQRLGDYVIRDSDGYTQRVPVVAQEAIPANNFVALKRSSPRGSFEIIGATLILSVFLMRGKSRRIVKPYGRPRTRSF